MRRSVTYVLMAPVMLIVACNKGVSPSEYVKYVEKPQNGLHITERSKGIEYSLQYQPLEYCVMLEKRSFSIPKETFKSEYERFKGLEHYVFRIDRASMDSMVNSLGDTSHYKKGVTEYFDFWIQKDIKLVKGNDTIPCSICQGDANSGISKYYTFSLGFSDKSYSTEGKQQPDRFLIFNNKILNTGNVTLCIKGKDMDKVPELKML